MNCPAFRWQIRRFVMVLYNQDASRNDKPFSRRQQGFRFLPVVRGVANDEIVAAPHLVQDPWDRTDNHRQSLLELVCSGQRSKVLSYSTIPFHKHDHGGTLLYKSEPDSSGPGEKIQNSRRWSPRS